MKVAEILKIYKDAIATAQDSGVGHVSIEDLQTFAAEVERTAAETPADVAAGDAAMEAYKAKLSALAYSLQQDHEKDLEMLRATIATGQSALKSALLINGGAAVAILAFIGNAWSTPKTAPLVAGLAYGLSLFVWGVMSAACAAGATYLSQAGFGGEFGTNSQRIGRIGMVLAILGVIGAYVLFGLGAWQSYVSLGS
jgi:hypothetical protein